MSINRSKEHDPRMWKKWERSGAIGTYHSYPKGRTTSEAPRAVAPLMTERALPQHREYLMTLGELYDVAIANLGAMDTKPYSEFKEEMGRVAREKGVTNPLMGIDISLKEPSEFGVSDMPYPISEEEWEIFIRDARTMANFMPRVHVVDGDKYVLPI